MRKTSEETKKLIASLRLDGESIEELKKTFMVTERQINSYVEKYRDDAYEIVPSKKKPLQTADWEQEVNRTDLTEEYIMRNHKKLLRHTDDRRETKAEFIVRQEELPCIVVDEKDSQFFIVINANKEYVDWGHFGEYRKRVLVYPNKEEFNTGELVYVYDKIIHVDDKILNTWGFRSKTAEEKTIFYVTNPLKIYRTSGYAIIKFGGVNLDYVLEKNKLDKEENRSREFNQWLYDKNYL